MRVSFTSFFGVRDQTAYHELDALNATCGGRGALAPCAQTGCAPGSCAEHALPPVDVYAGDNPLRDFLLRVVGGAARALAPVDALLLNLGLRGWLGGADPLLVAKSAARLAGLHEAADALRASGDVRELYWKVTADTRGNDYNESVERAWARADLAPRGWRLFDTGRLTEGLVEGPLNDTAFVYEGDGIHFGPSVYRGLNQALLFELCGDASAPFARDDGEQ